MSSSATAEFFYMYFKVGDNFECFAVVGFNVNTCVYLGSDGMCTCHAYKLAGACTHNKGKLIADDCYSSGREYGRCFAYNPKSNEISFFANSSEINGHDSFHRVRSDLGRGLRDGSDINIVKLRDLLHQSLRGNKTVVEIGENFVSPVVAREVSPVKSKVREVVELPDWAKYPKPKDFIVSDEVWREACFSIHTGDNILITGPSGSGKSTLAYKIAAAMEYPIAVFNFGAMQEPRLSLIGKTQFNKDKGTWFDEARFVKAVKSEKSLLLLDELTRADRGALNILLPLMDEQRYLALDEADDSPVINRGPNVAFIATANIGAIYTGTEALDKAVKERFSAIIDLWFPEIPQETQLLMDRTKISRDFATKLTTIASEQRKAAKQGDFEEYISTRMLLNAAKRIANSMSLKDACESTILSTFSSEGDNSSDRAKLRMIIQKHFKK